VRTNLVTLGNHTLDKGTLCGAVDIVRSPVLSIQEEGSNNPICRQEIKKLGSVDIWAIIEGKGDKAGSSATVNG
jgi:hypothetical protein